MATNYKSVISSDFAPDVIERSAIGCAGHVGSLYDGYRDCMLGQLNTKITEKLYQSCERVPCQIIEGRSNKKLNLLRLIGTENELQLSILSNLIPRTGIASFIDYCYPIDGSILILHLHYVTGEDRLEGFKSDVRQSIRSLITQNSATHIVTIGLVEESIQLFFYNYHMKLNLLEKIDDILEKIRITLESRSRRDNLTLYANDENLLGTITNTKIYSNIPELTGMTALYDICRYIDQLKSGTKGCFISFDPLSKMDRFYDRLLYNN